MKFYVGVTDIDWYTFLSKRPNEDINFWQPGGKLNFRALSPGAPFLFKLKSPRNAIAGLGFFSSHSILPLGVAWNIFQERNGVGSYFQLRDKIIAYRTAENSFDANPNIGCIVLTDPIFFKPEDWIDVPSDWSRSIVQGKSYETSFGIGKELWNVIEHKLEAYHFFDRQESDQSQLILEEPESPEYSKRYLTKVRYGQGAFRVQLTDAYHRRCSISGERTLPTLEAAHIKPFSHFGPSQLANGLLLRADLHKLFDAGYITVTGRYQVEVSKKIREEFENGKEYYRYNGQNLMILPNRLKDRPNPNFLDFHNSEIYNG